MFYWGKKIVGVGGGKRRKEIRELYGFETRRSSASKNGSRVQQRLFVHWPQSNKYPELRGRLPGA
jgi:hypothetical protein